MCFYLYIHQSFTQYLCVSYKYKLANKQNNKQFKFVNDELFFILYIKIKENFN